MKNRAKNASKASQRVAAEAFCDARLALGRVSLALSDLGKAKGLSALAATATGMKGTAEVLESHFRFRDYAVLRLLGEASGVNVKQTSFGPDSTVNALGVVIASGAGSASLGKLEMSEISIFDVGADAGDLLIETGAEGETILKNDSLFSEVRVRIAHGPGGKRVIENTRILSPIQELVP